jgi:hypothetical protein
VQASNRACAQDGGNFLEVADEMAPLAVALGIALRLTMVTWKGVQ